MRELIGIHYSPYTEKASWALQHHNLAYRFSEHTILLGMPALRLKTKTLFKPLTVPILLDGSTRLFDSIDIARHADSLGKSAPLFPKDFLSEIKELNALSEAGLDAGRALYANNLRKSKEAKIENLPDFIPAALRKGLAPLADVGIGYILSAFSVNAVSIEEHEKRLRDVLAVLRKRIESARGGPLLGGQFSYADIVMAVIAQFFHPIDDQYIRLGAATRKCCVHPELSREYRDVLEWRDSIYARFRRA